MAPGQGCGNAWVSPTLEDILASWRWGRPSRAPPAPAGEVWLRPQPHALLYHVTPVRLLALCPSRASLTEATQGHTVLLGVATAGEVATAGGGHSAGLVSPSCHTDYLSRWGALKARLWGRRGAPHLPPAPHDPRELDWLKLALPTSAD